MIRNTGIYYSRLIADPDEFLTRVTEIYTAYCETGNEPIINYRADVDGIQEYGCLVNNNGLVAIFVGLGILT